MWQKLSILQKVHTIDFMKSVKRTWDLYLLTGKGTYNWYFSEQMGYRTLSM
jgi:hypothetical protein